MEGLEPPRLAAPDPKSGAATNYATSGKEAQIYSLFGNRIALSIKNEVDFIYFNFI
jgi:hypothetical protein